MPTMVFKMRTILHLLATVWMLDLGLGQGTCGEDSATVVSSSLPDIEGCYFKGNYTSNGRDVYTNDGGEVQSGTTLAFMVQYLDSEGDNEAVWILSHVVDLGSGNVDNDGYICFGVASWSTIYNPAEIDTWICEGDDDDVESAEVSCGCVADDDVDADAGPTPSPSSSSPREETPEPSPAPIVSTTLPSAGSSGEPSSQLPPTASDSYANTPEPSSAPAQGVLASTTSAPTQGAYPYPMPTAAYAGDTREPSTVPPTPGDTVAISSMPSTEETGGSMQYTLSPLSPCSSSEWSPTPAPGQVSGDSQTPAPTVRVRCGFQLFGTFAPEPSSAPTSGPRAFAATVNPTASPSSVGRTPETSPSPSPRAVSVAPTMFGTSVSPELGSTSSPTTATQSPTLAASPISGDEDSAAPASPIDADTTSGATDPRSLRSVAVALICGVVSGAASLVMG